MAPFLLMHIVCVVCTYKEWVPMSWTTDYKKDTMEFHIVEYFILVNAVPLCEIKTTAFLMIPMAIFGTYL